MAHDHILEEQVAYYRAIAPEYEDHSIDADGQAELRAAFSSFDISGDVLELACGPGGWTQQLVHRATSITAVDASPEMIARAQLLVSDAPVRFVESDLFSWEPDRRYDAVFFGFWLSHVPEDRFEPFWAKIADCLSPGGQVFFVDDSHRTTQELVEGPNSPIVERTLNNGTTYRAIKVPYQPTSLQDRLHSLGWDISVSGAGPFYWGSGGLNHDLG